ncbi:MAG: dihydroorotate dehydrogenase electron transfer subunit [bacterium]
MNKPLMEMGRVEKIEEVSPGIWDLSISAPQIAVLVQPGQFLHLRITSNWVPFLRRPLSAGPINPPYIRLIFNVRGQGTYLLSQKRPGDQIDIIGPLGNPFPFPAPSEKAMIVAGGIGVVPLLYLQESLDYAPPFILGVRSLSAMPIPLKEVRAKGIFMASDDGSIGFKGTAIDLLHQMWSEWGSNATIIYGCGPKGFLKALKAFAEMVGTRAYVSLEVPMGCGLGACQSCAIPRSDGKGYRLVCRDGPIFECREVALDPEEIP